MVSADGETWTTVGSFVDPLPVGSVGIAFGSRQPTAERLRVEEFRVDGEKPPAPGPDEQARLVQNIATERTGGIPISPLRKKRAGMNNSLTRARLKPVLMSGGYGQFTYAFNYWGPTGVNRDTFVYVRRIERPDY